MKATTSFATDLQLCLFYEMGISRTPSWPINIGLGLQDVKDKRRTDGHMRYTIKMTKIKRMELNGQQPTTLIYRGKQS